MENDKKTNINTITPYLNRIDGPFTLYAHIDFEKPYKRKKLEKKYSEGPLKAMIWADTLDEDFSHVYEKLEPGGMVFFMSGGKKESIMNWRRENKHSPQIHTMPGEGEEIWFWYKPLPYTQEAVEEAPKPLKTYEKIEAPKPGDGHLTGRLLQKYSTGLFFFETGTYFGNGIQTAIDSGLFTFIYSVELDMDLAERAKELFEEKTDGTYFVTVYQGDSPTSIANLGRECMELNDGRKEVATFWLDAHASGPLPGGESGGTPVLDELLMIKKYWSPQSTIMIDDVRLFGSAEWSGYELEDALKIIKEINPDYKIVYEDGEVEKDILVAYVE
jgi:hypothetical protein